MLNSIGVWRLASSFQQARIILSSAELKVFESLGSTPRSAKWLSDVINCDPRGLTFLLDALASFGILRKSRNLYSIEKNLSGALSPYGKNSILPILRHSANMWKRWDNLTQIVKTGRSIVEAENGTRSKQELYDFIGAMHAIGQGLAGSVIKNCRIGKAETLLDIGGGSGVYTTAFLKRYPKLKAAIFDVPDVISIAKDQIAKAGLSKRVEFFAGDFQFDDLPRGFDVALLSAIIHQNSPEDNRMLYEKIYGALNKGGTLFIRDHVMSKDRTSPRLGAIFAINMLVATLGGGTYTFEEIKDGLFQAGFKNIKLVRKGEYMDGLVSACK